MVNTRWDSTLDTNVGKDHKQQLSSRLTLETAYQGRVLIYTFAKKSRDDHVSSRIVIDAWVDSILAQMRDLPVGTAWYHLNDFSGTDMHPSPYFVSRAREITRYRGDLKGHSAIVIPSNLFTQMIVNVARQVRPKHINIRLFFKRDEALKWLESLLEPATAGVSWRKPG